MLCQWLGRKVWIAQAKALPSNSLRDEFMTKHPEWASTDPDIFYSFRINSSSSKST